MLNSRCLASHAVFALGFSDAARGIAEQARALLAKIKGK